MSYIHFLPLEERIVLDATLLGVIQSVTTSETGLVTPLLRGFDFQVNPGDPIPVRGAIDWGDGSPLSPTINVIEKSPLTYGVVIPGGLAGFDYFHGYNDPGVYNIRFVITDQIIGQDPQPLTNFTFATATVTDLPLNLVGQPAAIAAVEGTLYQGVKFFTFQDQDPGALVSDYKITPTSLPDGATISNVVLTKVAGAFTNSFEVSGDILFKDVGSGVINWSVQDAKAPFGSGITVSVLNVDSSYSVANAPIQFVPVAPIHGVEGASLSNVTIASFTSGNPYETPLDFSSISIAPTSKYSYSNLHFEQDTSGLFLIKGDIVFKDVIANSNTMIGFNNDGQNFGGVTALVTATDAPLSVPLPITINANLGESFSGVVGSFVDANSFSLASDFTATIDWADGTTSLGSVVQNGGGGYNIIGSHTYAIDPNALVGAIHIKDIDGATADLSFNVMRTHVAQLLWGVDQATGQLFSVSDYAVPGAEGRVSLYGQLHTQVGTVIGDRVYAFTIDAMDAFGKNSAFIAVSKPVDGINTFSIGLINDINNINSRTEVTLFSIKGVSFDLSKDKITGLAIDPLTGNLEGLITRGSSPATLFVLNKNDLNPASATKTVQGYVLGRVVGEEAFGSQRVSNAQDLIFDQAGNLYVADATNDKLYKINNNTGEVIGVANGNLDLGIGEANVKALAYDPILNKVIGANAILNGGLPANDLVGLSTGNGSNTLDVHLLSQLKDIQGMAFLPQFALKSGADLGILIDIKSSEVDYRAGSGPVLLINDVNLIDFGDKNYDGASLTVDVGDNPNELTDILGIKNGEGIKFDPTNGYVRYKQLLIGTIDAVQNGKNGQALTIHFNANATEVAVESLMERLTYMNTSKILQGNDLLIAVNLYDSLNVLIAHTTINLDLEYGWKAC